MRAELLLRTWNVRMSLVVIIWAHVIQSICRRQRSCRCLPAKTTPAMGPCLSIFGPMYSLPRPDLGIVATIEHWAAKRWYPAGVLYILPGVRQAIRSHSASFPPSAVPNSAYQDIQEARGGTPKASRRALSFRLNELQARPGPSALEWKPRGGGVYVVRRLLDGRGSTV